MKLKYYLRGLGLGVIFATLIMTISSVIHNNNLSDEEIIKRAQKLGMVMQESQTEDSLFGPSKEETKTETESKTESESQTESESKPETESKQETESKPESESEPETESKLESESEQSKETESQPESQIESESQQESESQDTPQQDSETEEQTGPTQQEIRIVEIVVNSNDTPRIVSAKLYEAGLIDSAADFRAYLSKKGYSKKIRIGVYKIREGMSYEEIAKIITKQD